MRPTLFALFVFLSGCPAVTDENKDTNYLEEKEVRLNYQGKDYLVTIYCQTRIQDRSTGFWVENRYLVVLPEELHLGASDRFLPYRRHEGYYSRRHVAEEFPGKQYREFYIAGEKEILIKFQLPYYH